MAKEISCSDVFAGCTFHAHAGTEKELLEKVAEHAAEAHGVREVTPEVLKTVRAAVRESPPAKR